jgi:tetratricopeptide (TPR) repeat protein
LKGFRRDNTAMPDYYKAWEKMASNIDEDSSDEEKALDTGKVKAVKQPEAMSQAEMMRPTSGAAPNTHIVVKGARRQQYSIAEEFKQQGNSYFTSLEYSKAIECYTKCINSFVDDSDPTTLKTVALSNRSQCYLNLKAYPKALTDADEAVKRDPTHVKSYGRRGTAHYYINKLKLAK